MSKVELSCYEVERLKSKYGESDPFKLCRDLKIMVNFEPMGTHDTACKGFFLVQSRMRSITINSEMPDIVQYLTCAHELGHGVLHVPSGGRSGGGRSKGTRSGSNTRTGGRSGGRTGSIQSGSIQSGSIQSGSSTRSSVQAFHDFVLFDKMSPTEYEANIFMAELLLTDSEVLEQLNDDISFFGAAARLCVPPELLDFKFRIMKRKGYKMIDPPLMANSNFLKNIPMR